MGDDVALVHLRQRLFDGLAADHLDDDTAFDGIGRETSVRREEIGEVRPPLRVRVAGIAGIQLPDLFDRDQGFEVHGRAPLRSGRRSGHLMRVPTRCDEYTDEQKRG
jgi:hypothetical protein